MITIDRRIIDSNFKELVLGCGFTNHKDSPKRVVFPPGNIQNCFINPIRVDINVACKPDIHMDLNDLHHGNGFPLPDSSIDEIHAYEILEHLGHQGDVHAFFAEFWEYWRVLKPNGYFCATVPWYESMWAWGDPGHTRIITPGTLVFLDPVEYQSQLGKTPMTDYRHLLGCINFRRVLARRVGENFQFVLQAIKGHAHEN